MSPTVERRATPYGFELVAKNSVVRVSEPYAGVFILRYAGIAFEGFGAGIVAPLEHRISQGYRVTICCDCAELESYESGFRTYWAKWLMERPRAYFPIPILFRSKIVLMGINLVNPLVGNTLIACASRDVFEEQVDIALERAGCGRSLLPAPALKPQLSAEPRSRSGFPSDASAAPSQKTEF